MLRVTDDMAYVSTMLVIAAAFLAFGIALLWMAGGTPRWIRRVTAAIADPIRRALERRRRASQYQARHRPPPPMELAA